MGASGFWQRLFLTGAIAGAALVTLSGVLLPWMQGRVLHDFTVFWSASTLPVSAVYDVRQVSELQGAMFPNLGGPRPFAYPPTALLFIRPFGFLPFLPAFILWGILGLLAFICAGRAIASRTAVALAFVSPAVATSLVSGQTSLFVGALTVGGLAAANPALAGLLLGIGAAIKPQMFLLLPLALAAGGEWRTFAYWLATGGALALLSVLLWGVQPWLDWILALQDFPELLRYIGIESHGVTINALALRHGLPEWTPWIAMPLAFVMIWLTFNRSRSAVDRIAALICGAALISPYMMHYDLAALALASMAMLLDNGRRAWIWLGAVLAVTYVLAGFGIVVLSAALVWRYLRRPPGPYAAHPDQDQGLCRARGEPSPV